MSDYYEKVTKREPADVQPKTLIRTAAYCRVSTLLDEQEMSFETQKQYYMRLIERSADMVLVDIYADQGLSGLQIKQRKEFQRLMRDCEEGKIDRVLVKSISRFSRNAAECVQCLSRLRELGVEVLFEDQNLGNIDPRFEMVLSIHASIAQNESCRHSRNMSWYKRHSAEMGAPSVRCCYGYRHSKENPNGKKQWVICEEEAKRVRLLFALALSCCTYGEMTERLNQYEKAHGGEPNWTYGRVRAALHHEAYRGDLLTNKRVVLDYLQKKSVKNRGYIDQFYIHGHHAPIVSEVVFDTVQKYIKEGFLSASSRRRRDWLDAQEQGGF